VLSHLQGKKACWGIRYRVTKGGVPEGDFSYIVRGIYVRRRASEREAAQKIAGTCAKRRRRRAHLILRRGRPRKEGEGSIDGSFGGGSVARGKLREHS